MTVNSGVGWYEFITDGVATTWIAYVYEDGSVYLPEGMEVVDELDFRLAAARGRAHRLIRADDYDELAAAVDALRAATPKDGE